MKAKTLFRETRPHFLLLSVVLSFLGTSMAWYYGAISVGFAVLAFVGLLLAHISVNVLNDYFDFKSGVDLATQPTPFSGGSGILPAGRLQPREVLWLGLAGFVLAVPIGVFFIATSGWALAPLLIVGAFCLLLYTPLLTRMGYPEWAPGVGLGSLPVLGAFFVQTGEYTLPAVIAAVPSGFMVHNLLLLNEFPDVEADRASGRRTLPILVGKRPAFVVYAALVIGMYVWIAAGVALRFMPPFTLIALMTLPLGVKAIRGGSRWDDRASLVPALGANVMVILGTQLLLGIGYILARVVG